MVRPDSTSNRAMLWDYAKRRSSSSTNPNLLERWVSAPEQEWKTNSVWRHTAQRSKKCWELAKGEAIARFQISSNPYSSFAGGTVVYQVTQIMPGIMS